MNRLKSCSVSNGRSHVSKPSMAHPCPKFNPPLPCGGEPERLCPKFNPPLPCGGNQKHYVQNSTNLFHVEGNQKDYVQNSTHLFHVEGTRKTMSKIQPTSSMWRGTSGTLSHIETHLDIHLLLQTMHTAHLANPWFAVLQRKRRWLFEYLLNLNNIF